MWWCPTGPLSRSQDLRVGRRVVAHVFARSFQTLPVVQGREPMARSSGWPEAENIAGGRHSNREVISNINVLDAVRVRHAERALGPARLDTVTGARGPRAEAAVASAGNKHAVVWRRCERKRGDVVCVDVALKLEEWRAREADIEEHELVAEAAYSQAERHGRVA